MPSSYTTSLRLTLPATGELSGTWGTTVNTGITELTDASIAGYVSVAMTDADYTLTVANGATDQARRMMLNMTGTLTAARNVICPTASKLYIIKNATTGGFAITLKTSAGTGISIPNGSSMLLMCDGTDVVNAVTNFSSLTLGTPLLPASGGTGITSLGANVATFLGTPSSANLAAAVTDETGSGALVFGTSPTLSSPTITGTGTAAFGNLSYTGTLTGGTGVVALGTNQFYKDASGNVGIGTATPVTALNLQGGATISWGTSLLSIDYVQAGAGSVAIGTNGSQKLVVNASGNLGLGVTPSAWGLGKAIEVNGLGNAVWGVSAGNMLIAANMYYSGDYKYATTTFATQYQQTSGQHRWFNAPSGTAGNTITFTQAMTLDASGNLGIGTASPSGKLVVSNAGANGFEFDPTNGIMQTYNRSGSAYTGTKIYGLTFDVRTGASPTTSLYIDASNNVGIGTASPGHKLNVVSSGNSQIRVGSLVAGTEYYDFGRDGTDGFFGFSGAQTTFSGYKWSVNAGSEVMRINNAGNLGIGTSAPGTKLQVLGTIAAQIGADASNATGIRIYGSGSDKRVDFTGADGLSNERISGIGTGGPGILAFSVNNSSAVMTERMRLDSSGNLGLGVTPSAWLSTTKSVDVNTVGSLWGFQSGTNVQVGVTNNAFLNASAQYIYKTSATASNYLQNQGSHIWFNAPSGTAGNAITFTQAMTLDASGKLLVGRTSASTSIAALKAEVEGRYVSANTGVAGYSFGTSGSSFVINDVSSGSSESERARITSGGALVVGNTAAAGSEVLCASLNSAGTAPFSSWNRATAGDNFFAGWFTEGTATIRGSIDYNRAGGLVRYNTTSDYRAKDIIGPLQNPGATIDALKVYEGQMKGATQSRPMLVAHEAQEHAPYAVTGEKDAVNEDGDPVYQQIDVSSLVPLLLAEIQSLRARVASLETQP